MLVSSSRERAVTVASGNRSKTTYPLVNQKDNAFETTELKVKGVQLAEGRLKKRKKKKKKLPKNRSQT